MLFTKEAMSQKEIAAKVGASEQTISKWVNTEGWEKVKISLIKTKQQELQNLYVQLSAQNQAIKDREKQPFANSKEMDVIIKLTGAIKNLENETSVAQAVDVMKGYFDWLRTTDLPEAQRQLPYADSFIKTLFKR